MKLRRINITLDGELHDLSVAHAREVHRTNFSQLVTKLLVEELKRPASPITLPLPTLADFIRAKANLEPPAHDSRPTNSRSKSRK